MASIDNVVGFDIIIQDAAPSRSNFGTIAVLAYHDITPERLIYDTKPDGRSAMEADGFEQTHFAYRLNAAIGSQSPKVGSFKLYKRDAPNAQAYTLTPVNLVPGRKYNFDLNSIPIAHTNGAAETVASVCAALQSQLNAVDNVTAVDNGTDIGLSLTDPEGERMFFKNLPPYLTVKDTSPDAGIATDLSAALLEDPDFYGVLLDSQSELEINAAAAWCQANGKILHAQSMDSDILSSSTTDVCSDLQAAGYSYAKVWYSRDMAACLAGAIMGRQFSRNPGSTTWENKRLEGIIADPLTSTEIGNAIAKGCGLYLPYGKTTAATHNTAAASGRFLDITRDTDWLKANAQADLFAHLLNQEKVAFTQPGIDSMEDVLRSRFTIAEDAGVLAAGWEITLPTLGQVDPANKAVRQLAASDAFAGTFQGAIHGVDFSGVLAV